MTRIAALFLLGGIVAVGLADDPKQQIAEIEKQIAELNKKIADLKGAPAKTPEGKKLLSIADAAKWRSLRGATLSADGQWFAHRVGPQEGDGEVILKGVKADKETKFPAGDGFGQIEFSADSKWFAFSVSSGSRADAIPAAQQGPPRRPTYKVVLVNVASGDKTEFEGIRSFAFNGEAATHFVMRKAPVAPLLPPNPAGPPTTPAPPASSGSDLIIRDLSNGAELLLGNVAEFAFNKSGSHLALLIDSAGQIGNGIQLRDMKSGLLSTVESGKASYSQLSWNETSDSLIVLKGVEEKGIEGKWQTIVGIRKILTAPDKFVFDPKGNDKFPKNMGISTRGVSYTDDLTGILFSIVEQKRAEEPKKDEPKKEEPKKEEPKKEEIKKDEEKNQEPKIEPKRGPRKDGPPRRDGPTPAPDSPAGPAAARKSSTPDMVIWHWKDSRLQPQQQLTASSDKNRADACIYHIADKKFIRLGDETIRNVATLPKQKFGIATDVKPYEYMSNLDGRRYVDVYSFDLATGEKKKILTKIRYYFGWSADGSHVLYYDDGHFFTYDLAAGKTYNITAKVGTSFVDADDDHNVDKPPTRPVGWTADGKSVLLSDDWDIWAVDVHGEKATNLTVDGKSKGIHYLGRISLDPEEKGADLSKPMMVSFMEDRTKKSGFGKIEPAQPGGKPGVSVLMSEEASLGGLVKAKKADQYFYSRQTSVDSPDVWLVDASFKNAKKATTTNPQQASYSWSSGAKLIDFTSVSGKKLQGALYLPANYEKGKKYPTIVYIYEKLSDEIYRYTPPGTGGGFNKSIYTSNGYAVFMPDITYRLNDPGKSSVECILPALDAAIATGIVDGDKLGMQGHSWGGYQTAFMITQTDRFKAAVAGAPLTNLVSMYSSIYWNSGSANQPIFESSQGRFTAGYWDLQDAYIRNSPVFNAKNVKTPLLLLHNDKDGAVDFTQGIEYFNTLRRLQKPVVMLQYKGENHGLVKPENRKDYAVRMKEFFDHHLQGKPAPSWWTEGVPHLKLEEHLKSRPES